MGFFSKLFGNTTEETNMNTSFLALQQQRRSIYSLGNKVSTPKSELTTLIQETISESPSAFNSQSSRAVILFAEEHNKLWDMVLSTLKNMLPEEAYAASEGKINNCFKAGFGTVLYFEDQNVVTGLQEQFASYADNFPIWSEQASGMAQYAVWLALTEAGLGATVQHYNPIIDAEVKKTWGIPDSWTLRAQMPFGSIEAPAAEKTYMPTTERFKTFG